MRERESESERESERARNREGETDRQTERVRRLVSTCSAADGDREAERAEPPSRLRREDRRPPEASVADTVQAPIKPRITDFRRSQHPSCAARDRHRRGPYQ